MPGSRNLPGANWRRPMKATDQVKLAEAWAAVADNQTGLSKTQALLHARHWYQSALTLLPSGPQRHHRREARQGHGPANRPGRSSGKARCPVQKPLDLMKTEELIETARKAYREGKYAEAIHVTSLLSAKFCRAFAESKAQSVTGITSMHLARACWRWIGTITDEAGREFRERPQVDP